MSKSFEELISKANQKTLKKVSVSNAQDEPVLQAVKAAKEQNIATAIVKHITPAIFPTILLRTL